MKSFGLIVGLLFYSSFSTAQTITFVQAAVNNAGGATVSKAMGSNITAGNLLVVRTKVENSINTTAASVVISTTAGVSLTWNMVYTSTYIAYSGGGSFTAAMAYAIIPSTGAQTVQAVWTNGNNTFSDISIAEYSSSTGWQASALDTSSFQTSGTTVNTGTSCDTGSTGALSQAVELVIATCETWNSVQTWTSPPAGYTNRATATRNTDGWIDKTTSATTATSATFTIANDAWIGHIATFKPATTTPVRIRHRVTSD